MKSSDEMKAPRRRGVILEHHEFKVEDLQTGK